MGDKAFVAHDRLTTRVSEAIPLELPGVTHDCAAFQHGTAGVALPETQVCLLHGTGAKAPPGGVGKRTRLPVKQQDARGIRLQLHGGLIEDDVERQVQIEAGRDRHVDSVQCLHIAQPALRLLKQPGVLKRGSGLQGVALEELHPLRREEADLVAVQHQRTKHRVPADEWNNCCRVEAVLLQAF